MVRETSEGFFEGDYFTHLIIYTVPPWLKLEQFLQFI
jgi:hypothetical protein